MSEDVPMTELGDDLGIIDDTNETSPGDSTSAAAKPPKDKKSSKADRADKADKAEKADKSGDKAGKAKAKQPVEPPPVEPAQAVAVPREPEPYVAPLSPETRGLPTWVVVVGAVLAVGLIAATVLAVVQWRRADDLDQQRLDARAQDGDRQDAAMAASQLVLELLTYDYKNLDVTKQKVLALSTPEWADKYTPAFDQGLRPLLEQTQAVATAKIVESVTMSLSGDDARVVVNADQTVDSTLETINKFGSYFRVTLKRIDGTWKIDEVAVLGVDRQSSTPKAGAQPPADSTTTTTVPAG